MIKIHLTESYDEKIIRFKACLRRIAQNEVSGEWE